MHRRSRKSLVREFFERLGYRDTASILLSVVAVAAVGAAFFGYLSNRPPADGSDEAGFARDMMIHHAQAVQMAEIVRDKTEDERMRTIASDMAITQQGQIGQMQGWMGVWGIPITGTEPYMAWMGHDLEQNERMPGMATPGEIWELTEAPPEEADEIFLRLMIPHHESAVPMSEAIYDTNHPEVRQLAEAIALSQESEIRLMEDMLEDMGGEAPESEPMDMNHEGHDHE
ncbi:MAG: DUF305 domain-containing protein [Rubrobacter sp.]|nr:DUF305 domain-containing protein [Rubrobacter sp.]